MSPRETVCLNTITDKDFDLLYQAKLKSLANTHWTPVDVARKAIAYLGGQGKSVLDIGSGAGKFCLIAAACSDALITGVEKLPNLVHFSKKLAEPFQLKNLNFIQDDLINVDFGNYDHFYFFNSFEENINLKDKLNRDNEINLENFTRYVRLLKERFDAAPAGTRIVTYCGECEEIPPCYQLIKSSNKGKLKFWKKVI